MCPLSRVWDLASGELRSTLEGHTERVTSVAISHDDTTLVSGSNDKTVRWVQQVRAQGVRKWAARSGGRGVAWRAV